MKKHIIAVGAIVCLAALVILYDQLGPQNQVTPSLRVYAYSSFVANWGPGPQIERAFEDICQCRVELIDGDEGRMLIQRAAIDGPRYGVDVVVGLNQYDLDEALAKFGWTTISQQSLSFEVSKKFELRPQFLAYDFGELAFVYRKSSGLPKVEKIEDLLRPEFKNRVLMQDPRLSAPGYNFLLWLVREMGEDKAFDFLVKLKPQLFAISPSWSSAYGIFQSQTDKIVLSYTTSPIYHLNEEKSENFAYYELSASKPLHVEYVGVPEFCRQCELAKKFTAYMLTEEAQKILMEKNYMFPVLKKVARGTSFAYYYPEKVSSPVVISEKEKQRLLGRWMSEIVRGQK